MEKYIILGALVVSALVHLTQIILTLIKAAQQGVQPTCSTCGAKLRSGDIWRNECEKCHSKIASG